MYLGNDVPFAETLFGVNHGIQPYKWAGLPTPLYYHHLGTDGGIVTQ